MANAKSHPSQTELQTLFIYANGELLRKTTGNPIGTLVKEIWGIRKMTKIKGISYRVHRLIWIYFNGALKATDKIDHKDRNSLNNKIENLRCVSDRINAHNRKDRKNTWCIQTNKYKFTISYRAYTKVQGKMYHGPNRRVLLEAQQDRDFIYTSSTDEGKLQKLQSLKTLKQ